jgi:N-acetylmuramoyl-L-alanine amidase
MGFIEVTVDAIMAHLLHSLRIFHFMGLASLLALKVFLPSAAWGSPEAEDLNQSSSAMSTFHSDEYPTYLTDEIFSKTQKVLDYFEVPHEAEPDLKPFENQQNLSGLQRILTVLDPRGFLNRFITIQSDLLTVRGFQDRDVKRIADFQLSLLSEHAPLPVSPYETRLRTAALENPRNLPLRGLRIALDPGHMGGEFWDRKTGKRVIHPDGRTLSEGVLNLQTALLLEKRLTLLGAQVLITHRSLGPVSAMSPAQLPLKDFARRELRNSCLHSWFLNLIRSYSAGPRLYQAFEASPEFKKIFSSSSRDHYFISREDLDARVRIIDEYSPDLTLVIHYDTIDRPGNVGGINSKGWNRTKVYIPGTLTEEEFATREDRAYLFKHVAQPFSWKASKDLGRAVVTEMSQKLGLEYDVTGGGTSRQIEPGIWSRNLSLSRRLVGHAVSYLEVMHYNDAAEFERLTDYKYSLWIDGQEHPYSDRLTVVVDALETGVLNFLSTYR